MIPLPVVTLLPNPPMLLHPGRPHQGVTGVSSVILAPPPRCSSNSNRIPTPSKEVISNKVHLRGTEAISSKDPLKVSGVLQVGEVTVTEVLLLNSMGEEAMDRQEVTAMAHPKAMAVEDPDIILNNNSKCSPNSSSKAAVLVLGY